jgi:hypothetical protein
MLRPEVIERIRTIFLHQRPHVSLARATTLLGWTRRQMSEAIRAGEIEVAESWAVPRIQREELWSKALEVWSLAAIEEALGPDADHVLPPSLRLVDLHVSIPRYQIAMLAEFAELRQTSVGNIVTRELDDWASANLKEISSSRADYDSATRWPSAEQGSPPCR